MIKAHLTTQSIYANAKAAAAFSAARRPSAEKTIGEMQVN
jgi:hypothetical protein